MKKDLKIQQIVFRFDTILNFFVSLWLIFFPVDPLLMHSPPVIAGWVYKILGIGYLGFAVWQVIHWNKTTNPAALRFAFWLVVLPILFMGWALIVFHQNLKPMVRIVLWISELYMILLSGWYGKVYMEIRGDS